MRMIKIMYRNRTFLLLLTATILICSFYPRLSAAQGNPCETSGRCGAFGSCNSQDSPICTCLPGFGPNNRPEWDSGNWTGGCTRRIPLGCDQGNNGSRGDGFLKLQMIKIAGYSTRFSAPENQCEGLCLRNCSCIAYAYEVGIGNCLFWYGALMDMQKFPSGSGSDLYIRVDSSELDRHKKGFKKILIIPVIVGFTFACVFACVLWKWMAKRRGRKRKFELGRTAASDSVDSSLQDTLNKVNLEELPMFKFEILASATDNFSDANKLGRGGFGPVYKC